MKGRKVLSIVLALTLVLLAALASGGCGGCGGDKSKPQTGDKVSAARSAGIWVTNNDMMKTAVYWIDPATNKVTATIKVTNSLLNSICMLDNAVWVASVDMMVSKVDPATNAVTGKIRVATNPSGVSSGFGSLWVGDPMGKKVLRLDPSAAKVAASIKTGNTLNTLCADGFVAAANYAEGGVVFIDPKENKVTGEVKTGKHLATIALGHGAVWSASSNDNAVYRIDAATKAVTTISVNKPSKIAVTQ